MDNLTIEALENGKIPKEVFNYARRETEAALKRVGKLHSRGHSGRRNKKVHKVVTAYKLFVSLQKMKKAASNMASACQDIHSILVDMYIGDASVELGPVMPVVSISQRKTVAYKSALEHTFEEYDVPQDERNDIIKHFESTNDIERFDLQCNYTDLLDFPWRLAKWFWNNAREVEVVDISDEAQQEVVCNA